MHSNLEGNVISAAKITSNVNTPSSSFSKMTTQMKACVDLQLLRPQEGLWSRVGGVLAIVSNCLGYTAHIIYCQCDSPSFTEPGWRSFSVLSEWTVSEPCEIPLPYSIPSPPQQLPADGVLCNTGQDSSSLPLLEQHSLDSEGTVRHLPSSLQVQ